jgi:hypothetical protein
MHGRNRSVGGICLGAFGLLLGLLMLYTLVFEGSGGPASKRDPAGIIDVPVFFLERSEWRIFARGVAACVDGVRQLGRILAEDDDHLVVETAHQRRPIRFTWHGVRGEGQTRAELERVEKDYKPIAVIGSSNTLLTATLAAQLRDAKPRLSGGGPLLLVPWATSVPLLKIYPGRTFRFCAANHHIAALLVDCLKAQPGTSGPNRVLLVVDHLDPYSVDLASCFRHQFARKYPRAVVIEPAEAVSTAPQTRISGRESWPTAADQRHARSIWREVTEGSAGETWVVLPLQNDPARRMVLALNAAAPGRLDAASRPLTVICGDSVGPTTLASFANHLVFPVWSVSPASNHATGEGLEEDVMEQAETVAALLNALDRPGSIPTPDDLRAALLTPTGTKPFAPFGRPLDFEPSGEREGFAPGEVFHLRPDNPAVYVHEVGRWTHPSTVDPGGAP